MAHNKNILIIFGPTGVGKTDLALKVSDNIPSEIINMDMGQLYTPLSIGTAKPDWRNERVPHHLFDVLDEPRNFSVTEYRARVLPLLEDMWSRGKLPILVGGSGFYLKSLFFVLQAESADEHESFSHKTTQELWDDLYAIDPDRAQKIHTNDAYRIKRALMIWYATGKKPSLHTADFQALSDNFTLLFLTRDRAELYNRIDQRVEQMMDQGWLEEVRVLKGTPWEPFLREKKLIGYNELLDYLSRPDASSAELPAIIADIQQRTRHYAKRQGTFWRMLEKELKAALADKNKAKNNVRIEQINLTLLDVDLYIKQLSLTMLGE